MQQTKIDMRCQENREDMQKPNCVANFCSEMLRNGQIPTYWQIQKCKSYYKMFFNMACQCANNKFTYGTYILSCC